MVKMVNGILGDAILRRCTADALQSLSEAGLGLYRSGDSTEAVDKNQSFIGDGDGMDGDVDTSATGSYTVLCCEYEVSTLPRAPATDFLVIRRS